jgi:GNAT superfamily N-acetyltransferase
MTSSQSTPGQFIPVELEIVELTGDNHAAAVGVLSRGMRDNPIHQAVFGPDPARRMRLLAHLFDALLRVWSHPVICARLDGVLVGVAGMLPPGTCRPRAAQALRLATPILAAGPADALRGLRWTAAWARRNPREPHCHLGPVAVDTRLQGHGIGGQMLAAFAARMDAAHQPAYLETDKPENVRFYRRFGFQVTSEATVLSTPNWFMWRQAAP